MKKPQIHIVIIVATVLLAAGLFAANVAASSFYDYKIVGVTGQAGLTGMGDNPSINKWGFVAFVGQLATGEGIFVGDGTVVNAPPVLINPSFVSSTRRFGRAVQINDRNQIVARDNVGLNSLIRIWDGTQTGSVFVTMARGGGTNDPFDSVFAQPSINNNLVLENVAAPGGNDNGSCDAGEVCIEQVTFSALLKTSANSALATVVRTPLTITDAGQFNLLQPIDTPLRPMIADDGRVVVRAGILTTSPIRLYSNNFSTFVTIADTSMGFTAFGQSPGLSDDGVAVAFYGDLSGAGADALNASGHIVSAGPGIFVSIDDGLGTRRLVKIVGNQIEDITGIGNKDGICQVGESCRPAPELGFDVLGQSLFFQPSLFDVDARVGVVHISLGAPGVIDDNFVISFVGTPVGASRPNSAANNRPLLFSAAKGLWTVKLNADRVYSAIRTGVNGIAESSKVADDNQIIPLNMGFPNSTCVAPGQDLTLATTPVPPDAKITLPVNSQVHVEVIQSDTNGRCQTQNQGTDVQWILPQNGAQNSLAVSPGSDGILNSSSLGDDILVKPAVKPGRFSYHITSPLPVVQLGDSIQTPIGSRQIDGFSVFDPLANAAADDNQQLRTERRGDHRLVFWASSGTTQMIVRASHIDSDQDGLLDHWETIGIDMDQDGVVDLDLPGMGADPRKRDLFVQIDWLVDVVNAVAPNLPHKRDPFPGVTSQLASMFKNAPAPADGGAAAGLNDAIPAGITLHVDAGLGADPLAANKLYSQNMGTGQLFGGKKIPHVDVIYMGLPGSRLSQTLSTAAFDTIKSQFFGPNQKGAREFVFRYAVIADYFDFLPDPNNPSKDIGVNSSGLAEAGWRVGGSTPLLLTQFIADLVHPSMKIPRARLVLGMII